MKEEENKKSVWYGLWRLENRPYYVSPLFSHKEFNETFPKKFGICLRYNKFYEADSNRPRFQFCIMNREAMKDCRTKDIEIEQGDLVIRLEDAIAIARDCIERACYGESSDDLVVDVASDLRSLAFFTF